MPLAGLTADRRQEMAVGAVGAAVVLAACWPPTRGWLAHPAGPVTAASLSIAIAMWITMAAPVILAQGGPVDVQRWVTGFAAWGLAGSLLVAGDIVAHATLDGSSAAGPTRLLALLGVAAVPIAYGVRRSARCPVRHGWPMIAMHLLGMANPIGAVTLSMSMVLVCGVTRPRLIGSGSLMLVAAVATGG